MTQERAFQGPRASQGEERVIKGEVRAEQDEQEVAQPARKLAESRDRRCNPRDRDQPGGEAVEEPPQRRSPPIEEQHQGAESDPG